MLHHPCASILALPISNKPPTANFPRTYLQMLLSSLWLIFLMNAHTQPCYSIFTDHVERKLWSPWKGWNRTPQLTTKQLMILPDLIILCFPTSRRTTYQRNQQLGSAPPGNKIVSQGTDLTVTFKSGSRMLTAMWKVYRVVVELARREAFGSSESTLHRLLLWLRRRVRMLAESDAVVKFARNGSRTFIARIQSG